jgi:3-phenylpropionate/trans-cinnamate dioxygenase ferredoxin reductase component
MLAYKYLLVGGGMTAAAAVEGIRKVDPAGSIGIISREPDPPYDRPPLSKGLWKGKALETVWRHAVNVSGIDLHLGRGAKSLDPSAKLVTDDRSTEYVYGKLLLATGGRPRRLPFGGDNILYFRTFEDYRRLRQLAGERDRFAVLGGGFIGSEIAAALTMNGKRVCMIFPEEGIGAALFPIELSQFLNRFYQEKGVEVMAGRKVRELRAEGSGIVLATDSGPEVRADAVVAGLGIEPDTELTRQAKLTVGNGIVVDRSLRTSAPDIFAAGDVAEFFNPSLDKRIRVEHEDNANVMGEAAGRNMAGEQLVYDHLPFFYSDLFDLGYEAVGEMDSRHETLAYWEEPFRKGVVYYLEADRVRGVLLWNVWEQVEAARELIAAPGPVAKGGLKGRFREAASAAAH